LSMDGGEKRGKERVFPVSSGGGVFPLAWGEGERGEGAILQNFFPIWEVEKTKKNPTLKKKKSSLCGWEKRKGVQVLLSSGKRKGKGLVLVAGLGGEKQPAPCSRKKGGKKCALPLMWGKKKTTRMGERRNRGMLLSAPGQRGKKGRNSRPTCQKKKRARREKGKKTHFLSFGGSLMEKWDIGVMDPLATREGGKRKEGTLQPAGERRER